MHASRVIASCAAAIAFVGASASPTAAAEQRVRARVTRTPTIWEGYYSVVTFEYRCPAGSTGTISVSLSQPTTGAYYDTTSPDADVPTLTCDGVTHVDDAGVISLGYTEENASGYSAPYLRDTALGGGRATVTVTVTAGGKTATDSGRVDVQNRDV